MAHFSRKLQGTLGKGQVAWSVREKETYAIVLSLRKFRSWVASSPVRITVLTDHQSLQHWYTEDLNKATSSVGRRSRWHEFLSQFNLIVVYVEGKTQCVADPLSRAPWVYPSEADSADATFRGSMEAQRYAEYCDACDDALENFEPTPDALVGLVARIRGNKRSLKGKRRLAKREKTSVLLNRNWDYTPDPTFGPIVQHLRQTGTVNEYWLEQGWLVHQRDTVRRVCVPQQLVKAVLQEYHDQCHPEVSQLLSLFNNRYRVSMVMGDLLKAAKEVCSACRVCQAVKPMTGRTAKTMDHFPIPTDVFSSLCIDFLELPKSKGKDYVMVVVCRLSGYIVAIPCSKEGLTSQQTARLFLDNCVCFMGLPCEIVSDCDTRLTSA